MSATNIVVLDQTTAYTIDVSGVSNLLTSSGLHLAAGSSRRALTGFDPAVHSISVVTDADAVRALKALDPTYAGIAGLAVYPLFDGSEVLAGYLTLTVTATGTVLSVSAAGALSDIPMVKTAWISAFLAFMATPAAVATYTEPEDVVTDTGAVKDAIHFAAE
jgi:hypothetical protein